jgi:hypothetical protein
MRQTGHVECIGKKRNEYKTLVGKSEGKAALEIPRTRWENNIKMSLRKIG